MQFVGEDLAQYMDNLVFRKPRIQLNTNQEAVVQTAVDWFMNSSSELFEISGYAGTGKSVVLREIVNRLPISEENILPMAFTGQATMVMRQKGFKNAQTCHSSLYTFALVPKRNKRGDIVIDKRFNTPLMKRIQIPKDRSDFNNISLIIVDEAWMVPERIKRDIDKLGIKVIAAGDNGQLPPIDSKPGYLTGNNIHYLTEIMRQNAGSALVQLANIARTGGNITPGLYGNQVLVLFEHEITLDMIARAGVTLCRTNADKEFINTIVRRDILHRNSPLPELGDRLICRKNNWDVDSNGYPLVNGLTGIVAAPPNLFTKEYGTIGINFAPDKIVAYYENLHINKQFLLTNSSEEKKLLKESKFTNGDLFEYAYGSTVHLAQGSEYHTGIYISKTWDKTQYSNAMNYTAITRFKDKMIYALPGSKYWQIPFKADIINMKGE